MFDKLPAKPIAVLNTPDDEGLRILTVSSPDFQSHVQTLLTPEAIARATSFLPFSIVIMNDSGKYIWSFTVIYTYRNRISPAGTPWKFVVTPTASSADRARLLAPGARYLITPISDFIASCDTTGSRTIEPYLDEGMDRMIDLFNTQDSREVIDISIDSVIYEDGTLVGPDALGRLEKLNDQLRADADFFSSIDGLQGDALKARLSSWIQQESTPTDTYGRQQLLRARTLLRYFNEKGAGPTLSLKTKLHSTKRFSGDHQKVRRVEPFNLNP